MSGNIIILESKVIVKHVISTEDYSIILGTIIVNVRDTAKLSVAMALGLLLLTASLVVSGEFSQNIASDGFSNSGERSGYSFLGPILSVIVVASIIWMMFSLGEIELGRAKSLARSAYRKINPKSEQSDSKQANEPPKMPADSELEESLRLIRELKREAQSQLHLQSA